MFLNFTNYKINKTADPCLGLFSDVQCKDQSAVLLIFVHIPLLIQILATDPASLINLELWFSRSVF